MSILNPTLYCLSFLQPSIETSDKLDSSLLIQSEQTNKKPLNKKHHTHHNKRDHQNFEVEVQDNPIISAPPDYGERPYICQVQGCNKASVNFTEHSQHQKTHSKQVNKLRYQNIQPSFKMFFLNFTSSLFSKSFACTFPGCDKRYKDKAH